MTASSSLRVRPVAFALLLALLFVAGSLHPGVADEPDVLVPHVLVEDSGAAPERATTQGALSALAAGRGDATHDEGAAIAAFWEQNLGQWDPEALWVFRGGHTAALTHEGLVLARPGQEPVRLAFEGGGVTAIEVAEGRASTTSVIGGSLDVNGAPHAQRLRAMDVWPGIDVDVYATASGSLQYDFRVHPGADPDDAQLRVTGAVPQVEDGRLLLGGHAFDAPYSFQSTGPISSAFAVEDDLVSVTLGTYDRSRLLVIDPELIYGTTIASYGSSTLYDWATASTETEHGIYIVGTMYQPRSAPLFHPVTQSIGPNMGDAQGYVIHLDQNHELLAFVELRQIDAGGEMRITDVDVDAEGRVYLSGTATWEGLPATPTGYAPIRTLYDAFAVRLAPTGDPPTYTLDFSTHTASRPGWWTYGTGIVINPDGSFWLAGHAEGTTVHHAPATVENGNMGTSYNYNIFGMLWSNDPVPQHQLTAFVGDSTYDYSGSFDGDEEGNLYFIATTSGSGMPVTPGAIQPARSGSYDHFYGKITPTGVLEHLSYWGTPAWDDYVFDDEAGPAIDVIAEDEIVIAGTAGTCCVPLSAARPQSGGSGGYDAFVSHIRFGDTEPIFSTHIGSTTTDYGTAVAYDASSGTYLVGGQNRRVVQPDKVWSEPMPRDGYNGRTDLFIAALNPNLVDPGAPVSAQTSMVQWVMYVGPTHTSGGKSQLWDLQVTPNGYLQAAGSAYHTTDLSVPPTTADAIDQVPYRTNSYDGFFQRYPLLGGFWINATDGLSSATAPPDEKFRTLTGADVRLTAAVEDRVDWATADDLLWDLDGDGVFEDAIGAGPFTVTRTQQTTVPVCARLPPPPAGGLAKEECIDVFFQNRPPVPILELYTPPQSFGDPLPQYEVGSQIWIDGSSSFDPDNDVRIESVVWESERPEAPGVWEPDPDAVLGSTQGLTLAATYEEAGRKRVTLSLTDPFGATGTTSIIFEVLNKPFEVSCALGGPVRDGRWLDLDVDLPGGIEIKEWTLTFADRVVTGDRIDAGRIRSHENLTGEGPGTAHLSLVTKDGGKATCALPYHAGTRQVTADFTWVKAMAGVPMSFLDRSHPLDEDRPITSWKWTIDGVVVDASQDTQHTFAHPGVYMVTLTVSDGVATDSYTRPVVIGDAWNGPLARIGVASPPHYAGTPIQFTDASVAGDAPIIRWEWKAGLAKQSGADAVFSLPAGDHAIRLTVEDENGLTSTDTVDIRVIDLGSVVPEFSASTISPAVGEEVVFTDISRTGGVDITSRDWDFGDGSRSGQGDETTHRFWHLGTYNVTLTLHEAGGQRFPVTHQVTVVDPDTEDPVDVEDPEKHLPTADAGPDRRVLAGSVVVLDASGSTSRQSEGLAAAWRQTSGPNVTLVPRDGDVSLRVPFLPGEVLVFELIVSDAIGPSQPDKVRLHIVEEHADSVGQVAVPEAGFTLERDGRRVQLTAPGHAVDAEYIWDLGDGTTRTGRQVVHEYLSWDAYDVMLTVRDVHGQESSMQDQVEVRPDQDTQDSRIQESGPRFIGYSLQTLLLAGIVLAAGFGTAVMMIRRR